MSGLCGQTPNHYKENPRTMSKTKEARNRASTFTHQNLKNIRILKNFEPQTNLRFEHTKAQKERIKRCFMPPLCALFALAVSFT
jgi:hypothetical protein